MDLERRRSWAGRAVAWRRGLSHVNRRLPKLGLRREALPPVLLAFAVGLAPAFLILAGSNGQPEAPSMQNSETMVWTGVVLMVTGAVGLANFVAVKRIWGTVTTAETPAYDFIGASSLSAFAWGCWFVIDYLV